MKREWKTVALDEIATIERDAIQPGAISQGTAYLGLEHIESGGKILGAKPVDEGELASSKFKFTERHLLYGKLRPYLAKIACPDFTGICSTDILPILPGPHLERRFLCYFLRQPSIVDYANSRASGANLPRLSPSALAGFEIPLPPLAEQRRIAEVLDKAEALRAKRRAALAQLDSLTQSLFLDLFVTGKKFSSETLDSICELITDGTHYTPTYSETGVIFLSSRNVTSGYISWNDVKFIPHSLHTELHRRVAPKMNDILLAKNGTTGISAIVDRDCIFDIYVSLALLRPSSRVLPIYLQQAINSPASTRQFNASLKGIGVPNLHLKEIRKTRIPLPPLDLQHEFARRVAAVEKLKTAQRAALAELDALFASLQHRAFRGEL